VLRPPAAKRRLTFFNNTYTPTGLYAVWNIYRYATGILIVLILFRGGMVWWYLQVVLIL
jgi:hypothetical protein